MVHSVGAFLSLYVFWLLLSGIFTPFLLLAGAGCAAAVVLYTRRMRVLDPEGQPLQLLLPATLYWCWLLVEILKSGWGVVRIIVDPKLPISPTLVRFKPSQKTAVGLVTHANSITLTPGTISVEAERHGFLVHALTRDGAAGVVDSDMDRRVLQALEGGKK
jgi:multicomponent Na+:H+ antiporter subunit E